jgi:hypothetical protein
LLASLQKDRACCCQRTLKGFDGNQQEMTGLRSLALLLDVVG